MKKILILVALFTVVSIGFAPRASAADCYYYYDSVAYNGQGYSFCGGSGALCWNCVDSGTGAGCASNWAQCLPPAPQFQLASCPLAKPAAEPKVAETRSREDRVAQLSARQLL